MTSTSTSMSAPTSLVGLNPALIADPDLCTLATCPMVLANIDYVPSLAGNALYLGIFGVLIVGQLLLGIRYRTWGFMVGMSFGILLEVIGYVARVQMHYNPFTQNPFLMYLCCLTIGPAFLSGSVYLCFSRIVVTYSEAVSYFKPRTYTIIFISFDFIALLLQAIGGAIASTADDDSTGLMGIHIMVAGVAWQVVSLAVFAIFCAEYARRVVGAADGQLNPRFAVLRSTRKFKWFLWALALATLCIFVRSVFRCAELESGFHGRLANQEITFMILDGAMIILAVLLMTVLHPGVAFQGAWHDATWTVRTKHGKTQPMSENK